MSEIYRGACFILTTQHAKSIAVAPPFSLTLGAGVLELPLDTDTLGAFSGEVARRADALACARRKCEWGLEVLGPKAEFGLASEGSFGPHPLIPFAPIDHELLYVIDRRIGFHLHVAHATEQTNYRMKAIGEWDEALEFARSAQFPSHAMVVRPNDEAAPELLFKGIVCETTLREAFDVCVKRSPDGLAWVETDMRAHVNPTRMAAISALAAKTAERLATPCPRCETPGWGQVSVEAGLRCEFCGSETGLIAHEVHGCVRCPHMEREPRPDGLAFAPQMHCEACNP